MTPERKALFIQLFKELSKEMNDNAHNKGFYDSPRTYGDEIALAHSELSECLEGFRHGNPPSDKIPPFTSTEEEKADLMVRIMETAYEHNEDICAAMFVKMDYNANRPYKHGGKVL